MRKLCRPLICALTVALSADVLFGQAEAPAATASSGPLPFIGITPCRLVDTRNAAMPPGYGPPSLSPGVPAARTFGVAGFCGIGANPESLSLNVTVTNTLGIGYVVLYPAGSSLPPVSTLNYFAGQTVANAAIVPVSVGGLTIVAGVSGTDVIIDVNGYYAGSQAADYSTYLGDHAGNFSSSAIRNTGIGSSALQAIGNGEENTAVGTLALYANTQSNGNTAVGYLTLADNVGPYNTAVGSEALSVVRDLSSGNIAVGAGAGADLQSGSDNIYIGHGGTATESGTIRIGFPFSISRTFMAGIRGVTTGSGDALPVVIDSSGQLGTVSSSARTKEDIESMADASDALLRLRPVRFRYKGQAGDRTHFGLIAEEVEDVLPELVVHDACGNPETVLYHEMPAMLLNELQKQQAEIELLRARLAEVEALLRSAARE